MDLDWSVKKVIADAYGLGEDFVRRGIYDSVFHNPVVVTLVDCCFVTWTRDDHAYYGVGSTVAMCDGEVVSLNDDWRAITDRADTTRRCLDLVCWHGVIDATFVATELRGVPERIFLYPQQAGFNPKRICTQLRNYRAHHPPKIFPTNGVFTPTGPVQL